MNTNTKPTKNTAVAITAAFMAAREAKRQADMDRAATAKATMTVDLSPEAYGTIAEASVVHGCTMKEALEKFLNDTGALCDWHNEGWAID